MEVTTALDFLYAYFAIIAVVNLGMAMRFWEHLDHDRLLNEFNDAERKRMIKLWEGPRFSILMENSS